MAAEVLALLAQSTLAATLALLAVLAARCAARRAFGAGVAFASWALVPAAAIAPLLAGVLPDQALPLTAPLLATGARAVDAAAATVPATLAALLLGAWLAGLGFGALALLARQRRFLRGLGRLQARSDGCWASSAGAGPLVFGLLHPRIVVPHDFEQRFDPPSRALVLAHERTHLARGDLVFAALAEALRLAFWFHPLLGVALARFRADMELACDAAVLARHRGQRRRYAEALLAQASPPLPRHAGCGWHHHPLKERLRMLSFDPPGRLRRRLGSTLVAALAAATLATGALAGPTPDSEPVPRALDAPAYPAGAAEAGLSGRVVLRLRVDEHGKAQDVSVETSSGEDVLDEAAVLGVQRWEFEPARRDGAPVSSWVLVPVEFEASSKPDA